MFQLVLLLTAAAAPSPADFRAWGLETIQRIQQDLLLPDGRLYAEFSTPDGHPSQPAFNWGLGVMIPALTAAARADARWKSRLNSYVEATRAYWNSGGPVPGYDVLPGPKRPDRYYDDNEWMVLALSEASDFLKSKRDLGYSREAFRFVLSGEDGKLGGGIYWREGHLTSKNTCSNAPAAAGAVALYRLTHDKRYLADAERLYAWTRTHLRDPEDGLYWDNVSLTGNIERTKWSYNSALMLRAAVGLYELTKRPTYAEDAREIQRSSLARWVASDGGLMDGGKFMFLLVESWLAAYRQVPEIDDPRGAITIGLSYIHTNCQDNLGHFGDRWDKPVGNSPLARFNLIDQAAAARALLVAAAELGTLK